MKKFSIIKASVGVVIATFFAFLPGKTFAASNTIKIGGEDLWSETGSKANTAGTAKYTASNKTLELNGLNTTSVEINVNGSITIKVTGKSKASSITATGDIITMTGTETIQLSSNYKVTGDFILNGPTISMTAGDLIVTDGNLKLTRGSISAKNITLKDTNDSTQNKITISDGSSTTVSGSISAIYSYTTATKGITLASTLCTSPTASIINLEGASGTTTTFSANGTTAVTGGLNIATTCTSENPEIPETIDTVYIYAIILVVSSTIFIYRRHLAKH